MKIMITNGGAHPADKWAEVTADSILDLIVIADEASTTPEATAARREKILLKPKLFETLMDSHDAVQKDERGTLAKRQEHMLLEPLKPEIHIPAALAGVNKVLFASIYADHFRKEEVQKVIFQIIGQHFADSMHIERKLHADSLVKGA